ncbi:MAG: PAS domain S-box protein [Desulfuromonadales bacterium]
MEISELQKQLVFARESLESANSIVLRWDKDGIIHFMNDFGLRFFGYSSEELIGQQIMTIVPEVEKSTGRDMSKLAKDISIDPDNYKSVHSENITKDGRTVWVTWTNKGIFDEQGNVQEILAIGNDITALKKAEKEREQYFSFFQNAADMKCIANPHGSFLKVNPAFTETLGYSEYELLSKPILEFVHPDDRQTTLDEIAKQLQKGSTDNFENRYFCKDGSVKWLSWRVNVNKGDGNVYATARDITEWKKADEALRSSRNLLQTILENVPTHVFWKDTESNYLGCNTNFARAAGFSCAEDLLGKDDFQMAWHEQAELYRADDKRIMAAGEPVVDIEEPQTTPDGQTLCIRTSKVPLHDVEGNVFGLLGIFEDITERKEAEESLRNREAQLRTIFEASQAGIILVDLQGKITFANNSMAGMFGVPLDKLTDTPYAELIYSTEKKVGENLMREIIQGEIQSVLVERHYIRADGSNFWGLLSGKRLENPDGSLQFLVGIITDITEQKVLQDQLAQAQKIESVGQLAGGVAHDFNNMLGVILGHTELALRKADPASPLISDLEEIGKAAKRSADLTRQLLTFARKQAITPKVLDLNESVAGTLTMLQRLIGENIKLSCNPAANLWPVKVDPSQIDQILTNLCVNSRDAISGSGKISIKTANTSWDKDAIASHPYAVVPGDYVQLCVSDDGCGMDKEAQSHIFEPFYTTKEVGSGTGLGLATVYGAVKQNHGFFTVYSEVGLGTVFNIYLPRTSQAADAKQETAKKPLLRGTETVLLVEDDEMLLRLVTSMLEESGFTVLAADTTDLAQTLAKEHPDPIHLLISDMIMPVMNGKELSTRLQPLRPDMKVLFLSGYTADIISSQGVIEDEIHFLQKPFSFEALTAKVREVLDDH